MKATNQKIKAIHVDGKEFRIFRAIYTDGPILHEIKTENLLDSTHIYYFGLDKDGKLLFQIKTNSAIIYYV